MIFHNNNKGRAVACWSDPMLAQTVKGIKNLETMPEAVTDPLTEKHLKIMFQYVNVKNEECVHFWTMIIFLFRILLRVGHMVMSPHTLHRSDVEFFKWGVLISVNTSKTKQKGSSHKIPFLNSQPDEFLKTTAMRAAGVPLSHIKERGQLASDCVFKYIKPIISIWDM